MESLQLAHDRLFGSCGEVDTDPGRQIIESTDAVQNAVLASVLTLIQCVNKNDLPG